MTAPAAPWQRVLQRYLEALLLERGLAQQTVDSYGRDLRRMGGTLEEDGLDPLAADQQALAGHLRQLRRAGLAPRSGGVAHWSPFVASLPIWWRRGSAATTRRSICRHRGC